ncbi:hypothetical protein AABM36_02025 [Kocuria sp. KSNUG]|uniref:hypothetical protein n=1 Tax=Kocuria sp. KSNUG TaxID=3136676 RepID=UPI003C2BA46E
MTQQQHDARTLTRRTLAKGAAWSIPVIAAASAAPAVAASGKCLPSLRFSGGLYYDFGTIYTFSGRTTNQYLTVGGQTYVDNLPQGVTVQSITYNFWIQNRKDQTSSGPGAFWMGDSTASSKDKKCTASGCTSTWTPTAGSGFDNVVTNTGNNLTKTYPNGENLPSWDVNMTWSAARDTVGTYTTDGAGCRDFTTGPSAKFRVNYTGVPALSDADVRAGKERVASYSDITVTLSTGEKLRKQYMLT